ncbi:MFS transporter [Nocardioides ferulae]|uniref:MFS transporter n=1 Tax=Nocardioides ferulae TaxID=2340821 RepID=UPI000EB3389C|nr:MFS transporter [Nocardioides ferulae]
MRPEPEPSRPTSPALCVVVLCLGGLAASLTQTLVIPIQGELPGLLGAAPADTAWVVTITLLAGAVSMPITGSLADLFGKQRMLVATAGCLLAGSLVCAVADALAPMLVGRALQGLAMGFIPVGISLVREVAPPALAASGIAAMSATLGVGGAVGLPLSAWVVQVADWHAIFWLASALAAAVTALAWFALPRLPVTGGRRFDGVGALGLAVGLGSLLVGISKATDWGWTGSRTLVALAVGLATLALWAVHELRRADPLVDLRATAQRPVLLTNIAAIAIGFGMMAQAIVVPQLLQLPEETGYGLGQSLLAAGLWMAPGGVMMLLVAPLSGRLISRWGGRPPLLLGAGVISLGYALAAVLMDAPWQLLVASCVTTAGVGLAYAAMPTLIMDAVPPREAAAAVGLHALMRSVGTTLAAAVMGTMLSASTSTFGEVEVPSEGIFRLCFAVGAVAAFVGLLLAAGIPRRVAVVEVAAAPVPARRY